MNQYDTIRLDAAHELEAEVNAFNMIFVQKETEDNWQKMEKALMRFTAITRGSSHLPGFVGAVKVRMNKPICSALNSDRTRLSRTAMLLVEALADALGDRFEALADVFCPVVLRLAARANSVSMKSANSTLKSCIAASGIPSFSFALLDTLKNARQNKVLRLTAMECLVEIVNRNEPDRLQNCIDALEVAIREGVTDQESGVREQAKTMFQAYCVSFPLRVDRFVLTLSASAKKNLKLDTKIKPRIIPTRGRSLRPRTSSIMLNPLDANGADREDGHWVPSLSPEPETPGPSNLPRFTPRGAGSDVYGQSGPSGARQNGPARVLEQQYAAMETTSRSFADAPSNQSRSNTNVGAPQRVLREDPPEPFPSRTKLPARAMRIPAAAEPPYVTSPTGNRGGDDPTRIGKPKRRATNINQIFNSTAAAVAHALKRPESSASATSQASYQPDEVMIDINNVAQKHRSHDWSSRFNAQETIRQYVAHANHQDFKSKTMGKATDLLISGLQDPHFKVVQSSLDGIYELLKCNDGVPEELLAQILPRVAAAVYVPQAKVKPGVLESGTRIVDLCKTRYRSEVLCAVMAQGLSQPEFGKGFKMKVGCVGLLASFTRDEWVPYVNKISNLKTMMVRLAPLTAESDAVVQRNLRWIFQSMHEPNPEGFYNALSGLKPGDRRVINMLFGKDIFADRSALVKIAEAKPPSPDPRMPGRTLSPGVTPRRIPRSPMRPSPLKVVPVRRDSLRRESIVSKASSPVKLRLITPALHRRMSRSRSREGDDMKVDDLALEELDMSHIADLETDEGEPEAPPSGGPHHAGTESDEWVSEPTASAPSESNYTATSASEAAGETSGLGRLRRGPMPATSHDAMQLAAKVAASNGGRAIDESGTPDSSETKYEDGRDTPASQQVVQLRSAIPVPSSRVRSPTVNTPTTPSPTPGRLGLENKKMPLRLEESQNTNWSRGKRDSVRLKSQGSTWNMSGDTTRVPSPAVPEDVVKTAAQEVEKRIEERRRSVGTPMEVKETVADFVDRVADAVEKIVTLNQTQPGKPQGSPTGLTISTVQPLSVIDAVRQELANRVTATRLERERREERERSKRGLSWDSKVLSPDNLQDVLFAAAEEESWGEAPGDYLTPQELGLPPTGMAAVVQVTRKKRRSLWETRAHGLLDTILGGLQEKQNPSVVKNCLMLLKELLLNQFDLITDRTTDVLLGVLKCETEGGCSAEDLLEIAIEIDAVLKAYERVVPGPQLRAAVASALADNIGYRVCFEILGRVLNTPAWVDLVGDMGEEAEDESEADKEERKARKVDEHVVVTAVAKGLVSRKSATRKAAFDLAVALVRRRGPAVSDELYAIVGKAGGEARLVVVKEMVERRIKAMDDANQ
ncbi:hypothetical protein HK104_010060 [Borealophlyctis nickersoniae]|nr:hypothetical protein HK104_010060 [Borealophlyctis nickersoniae]